MHLHVSTTQLGVPTHATRRALNLPGNAALQLLPQTVHQPANGLATQHVPGLVHSDRHHSRRGATRCACTGHTRSPPPPSGTSQPDMHEAQPWPEPEPGDEAEEKMSLEERMELLMAQMGYSDGDLPDNELMQQSEELDEQVIRPRQSKNGLEDFDDLQLDDSFLLNELGFTPEEVAEQRALAGAAFTDPEGVDLTFDEMSSVADDAPPDLRAMVLDQRVYGPEAVLLAGFPPEELGMVRAVLDAAGGQALKVLPVSSSALYGSIDEMLWTEEQDWSQARDISVMQDALGAWGMQRTVLFSGLNIKTQATVLELLEGVGLGTLAVGMILEEDGPRRVGDVLADAVQAERQRKKMEQEMSRQRVPRTSFGSSPASSPASRPGAASAATAAGGMRPRGFSNRVVDKLPDLNEIMAAEMQKQWADEEAGEAAAAAAEGAPGTPDPLLASLSGAPLVPPVAPTTTTFAPAPPTAAAGPAVSKPQPAPSSSPAQAQASAAVAQPPQAPAQPAQATPVSNAGQDRYLDPVINELPAYENPLDELLGSSSSPASSPAPAPAAAAVSSQASGSGSAGPSSTAGQPAGLLDRIQAALSQGMSPDDLKRIIDEAYAQQAVTGTGPTTPSNAASPAATAPVSTADSTAKSGASTASRPAPSPARPAGPYGPELPPPTSAPGPQQDLQGLLNMKPEALSALTGKNVRFVDLSKLPSKYRKQMAEQAKQRREALEAGARQQAAGAPADEVAEDEQQAGDEAEVPEIRSWQKQMMQQAAMEERQVAPGPAPGAQGSSRRAKLLGRLGRMKQSSAGRQGSPAQSDAAGKEEEEQEEEEDVGTPVSASRRISASQLQSLVEAAEQSGLDPQQMMAEALALGMIIPASAAQAVGVSLPPEAAVAAARAALDEALQGDEEGDGGSRQAGVRRSRKRLGNLRGTTSGGRPRDLSVDIEEDGVLDTDEFESNMFEDGSGGYVQVNSDGTLDVEAVDLGDGAPGVSQGLDTLLGESGRFKERPPTRPPPSVASQPVAPPQAAPAQPAAAPSASSSRSWGQGWSRKPRGSSPADGSDHGIEVIKTGEPVMRVAPVPSSRSDEEPRSQQGSSGQGRPGGSAARRAMPGGSRASAGAGTPPAAPAGAATMSREQLAAVAARTGLDFDALLEDARSKGIIIPDV